MNKFSLLFLVLLIMIFCIKIGGAQELKPQSQDLVVNWEKKYKDTAFKIIYGEAEMPAIKTKNLVTLGDEAAKTTDTVKIKYPKVIFIKDKTVKHYDKASSIKFLDVNGNVKKEILPIPYKIGFDNVNISKNKKFICLTTFTKSKF